MHRLGFILLWIGSVGCAASSSSSSVPASVTCNLGPPIAWPAPQVVAGYPLQRVVLEPAVLAARQADLARRAPGWTITLAPSGEPIRLEGPDLGPFEEYVSDARVAHAREVLVALALVEPTAVVHRDVRYVVVDGHPELMIQQTGRARDQTHLLVDRVPPPPALPVGAHELTDDEIRARWGADWQAREVRITTYDQGHPCDRVVGYTCGGGGPTTLITCHPLSQLSLVRKVVESADGLRHVVLVIDDWQRAMAPVEMAVPSCVDTITGEALAIDRCQ